MASVWYNSGMDCEQYLVPLDEFDFGQGPERVIYVETMSVAEGVECDVYKVEGDVSKDLGIIRIESGHKTPLQRVLKGERTIEGHRSGEGEFALTRTNGDEEIYSVCEGMDPAFSLEVGVREKMQWRASGGSPLEAYEICMPPYEDGRFEDLG
jgi:hypothetical protein